MNLKRDDCALIEALGINMPLYSRLFAPLEPMIGR